MEKSFRKELYSATKKQHQAVEEVFNFGKGVNQKNLMLFLNTMFISRSYFNSSLQDLETSNKVNTYNSQLINALQKDIPIKTQDLIPEIKNILPIRPPESIENNNIGVFYVFAGSSAGAKVILSLINKFSIPCPLNYLNLLITSSKNQMITLEKLLSSSKLNQSQTIESAQFTFNIIHKIALDGLQKRNS